MMTTHVINKGYQRIGFFGDLDYSFSFEDRFIGFKQSLLKNNIVSYSKVDEYIQKYSFLQGIEEYVLTNQIDKIIEILNTKKLPEVLVCANDSNAFAVITALKDMGLKVPKDISVVGFDDTPLCVKSVPQITTVQVQKELMGEVAVSNLIDRIHRKDNIPMTQLLSVKIVERTNWEGSGAKKYKVQVSNDGQVWTDISDINDGDGGLDELSYKDVTGRYVRMLGIEVGSDYGYSLWEFEVYGTTLKSKLQEIYKKYKDLDISSYTPNSIARYQEALNNAVKVYNDDDVTSEDILKAIDQLEDSVKGLTKIVDKMELEETINSASKQLDTAKYTPQSIELLTVTLQKAKEVFNDDNATKHEVDEAINKLNEVVAALVEKADKNNLISIFNTALKLDKEKYTSESLTKVEALLEKVESIIDDENAAQAEVDEMYDQLYQALDQLVIKEDVNTNDKVEGDVTVIPTPEKEIPKDDSTSAAKTGDSVSIQILAGTLLISILGIGILRKKKQS